MGLGYSFTNLVHDVESTAGDPNVQRAAVAAIQAYNPEAYNQATVWADRARGYAPMPPVMPMPGPPVVPVQVSPGAAEALVNSGAPVHYQSTIQQNNWMPWAVIGAGSLVLLYLYTKR